MKEGEIRRRAESRVRVGTFETSMEEEREEKERGSGMFIR